MKLKKNNNIKKLIKHKKRIGIENDLSENEDIFYDAVTDLTKLSKEETLQIQKIIEEQTKKIQQLKNENEELKESKKIIENFDKFKYNAITIFENKNIEKFFNFVEK